MDMYYHRKNILAIDDDVIILTGIRAVLERHHDVCLAKNVDIASTILKTTDVSLILLDMEMPGISGMEFLEFIQKDADYYNIPVIVVSSHGMTDTIVEAKQRGAADFVVKPFNSVTLLEKTRSALKTARKKIGTDELAAKLHKLKNACITGKSGSIEKIIKDLESVSYDMQTDALIAEICQYARNMEYNLVNEKLNQLLNNIEFDKIKNPQPESDIME
jgi:DNA-binding NtrC family response regulator